MRGIVMRPAFAAAMLALALGAGQPVLAQNPPATPPPQPQQPQQPPARSDEIIRSGVELITTDVIVRDHNGQFIADLNKDDFEVFEDGVQQKVISFHLTHGGRNYNIAAPPPPPIQEGIILPPTRPTNDAAGRIFVIFVDDLHLDFRNTGRIRDLFKKISNTLIHDGDMFAMVSTGPSSIAIDLTYDRKRLDIAINKISGAGLAPNEILDQPEGAEGVAEIRYRAHVAFSTAYDIMKTLEQVHNRRKAFIYVSNGYDFDPFQDARRKLDSERYGRPRDDGSGDTSDANYYNPFMKQGNLFADADLAMELSELTRAANRANATIYTIDPRGLVGGPDLDQKIDMVEWQNYVRSSQDSLRVLAELTGGIAVVNQNDFEKGLKRIDNETSDYYVIGYYSNNPDPRKRRRQIEVKVNRPNVEVRHRTEYALKPPPPPIKTSK